MITRKILKQVKVLDGDHALSPEMMAEWNAVRRVPGLPRVVLLPQRVTMWFHLIRAASPPQREGRGNGVAG